jgi:hypothetical protein
MSLDAVGHESSQPEEISGNSIAGYSTTPAPADMIARHAARETASYDGCLEWPARHYLQSIVVEFLAATQRRTIGHVSDANGEDDYRNLAVNRLRPSELQWALNHDAVHGIAYAFRNPVAVAESIDDPQDDRKTYLVRVRRDDLAIALGKINDWIVKNPGPAGMQAYGFVRALSREGLSERKAGDE